MTLPADDLGLPEERDLEFFRRELKSFVPDRIFDAHAHSRRLSDVSDWISDEGICGWQYYERLMQGLHPDRQIAAYFIPAILEPALVPAANECNVRTVAAAGGNSRGIFLIRPQDDPEWARQEAKRLGLIGFKCYSMYATTSGQIDPEASIPSFLPEPFVKIAHEEGWFITLHVFKKRAMADPENIHWVRHYCQTYPNMRLILAHSARGFNPNHNLEGLPELKHLDNLYFDTSVNCEPVAHQAIIRLFGHKKLLYGTDAPESHLRGRSFAVDDTFRWVYPETPIWNAEFDVSNTRPVFIGLEHLRSLKWACWSERLSDGQVEDIFWNNAMALFGIR